MNGNLLGALTRNDEGKTRCGIHHGAVTLATTTLALGADFARGNHLDTREFGEDTDHEGASFSEGGMTTSARFWHNLVTKL